MDSDTQPNPKPNWKGAAFVFLGITALFDSIAAFIKLTNPQTNVLSFFYLGAAFMAAYLLYSLLSVLRLKVITILSLLASIVFMAVSFLTKDHNPKLSSLSFLSAFFALAGAIAPILVSRIQTFLHDRWWRGTGVYIEDLSASNWGVSGSNWHDGGSSDCGGDGGGGGDCGG
ncbi:MAG: hypothetical protein ACAF41_03820 [Leptolyngbya sp. BL-A-14]